jgi:hypothetical protein
LRSSQIEEIQQIAYSKMTQAISKQEASKQQVQQQSQAAGSREVQEHHASANASVSKYLPDPPSPESAKIYTTENLTNVCIRIYRLD